MLEAELELKDQMADFEWPGRHNKLMRSASPPATVMQGCNLTKQKKAGGSSPLIGSVAFRRWATG